MRPLVRRFFFPLIPRGRVAAFRFAAYGFVLLDVLVVRPWVIRHGDVPSDLYHPLVLGRILPLPVPTPGVVRAVEIALLVSAAIALSGRLPRAAGAATFVLYLEWMIIAFSYGKVDHDRVAFLIALAVLPTAGPARWGDMEADEAAGWAIRMVQLGVVATYFLAAIAKFRFGGMGWVNGATLMRAVIRRGTFLAAPLKQLPWVLRAGQWLIVSFELTSPLMLAPGRLGRAFVIAAFVFHIVTFAGITIMFWPHVVCLLTFLPLERLRLPQLALFARAQSPPEGASR